MRIDVVSIFPAYLDALRLSLPGRAVREGIVDLAVHDLRDWSHDRHRTVDDTPYGGGAGMVMRPEPWGEALDALLGEDTVVVVPSPAGRPLTQALAGDLAGERHLLLACGRYEGIDQRVLDHAGARARLLEVSVGDVVLNGGEVAALAIVESVVRLLPGFMGNPESLAEESHTGGLLEYPVYTKPASWRGLDVPEVLLSGDHGRVARWRHDQAVRRTVERRPDLLPPQALDAGGADDLAAGLVAGVPADQGEWLTLQLACWTAEQAANPDVRIPALHEGLADVVAWWPEWTVRVLRSRGRLVGGFRARRDISVVGGGAAWEVGRLMVAPDLRGRGIGRRLLAAAEALAPTDVVSLQLVTGARSERNLRMYRRAGYSVVDEHEPGAVRLSRPRR